MFKNQSILLSRISAPFHKFRLILFVSGLVVALACGWFLWSPWPDPKPTPLPWRPDAIVILGGGDAARVLQGKLLADRYPNTPIVVTGDAGVIVRGLLENGISDNRIIHEVDAKSTFENSRMTAQILECLKAQRVALVSNWFHIPRTLAVFRKEQPEREFAASFELKSDPVTKWERGLQRRERLADLFYSLRYGVWCW